MNGESRPKAAPADPAKVSTTRIPPTPAHAVDGAHTAEQNGDWWWRDCARRAVLDLARSGEIFSADDVWEKGIPEPDAPTRIGGILMGLSGAGAIECVGVTTSRRTSRHGGLQRLWRGTEAVRDD